MLAAMAGATLAELRERLGHSTVAAALRYQHGAHGRGAKIASALSAMAEVPGGQQSADELPIEIVVSPPAESDERAD
jgi:hypothetical protein